MFSKKFTLEQNSGAVTLQDAVADKVVIVEEADDFHKRSGVVA